MGTPRRFVVVGAGISGLAAAWDLSRHGDVTVYDPARPGGKLATALFEGHRVELGADAFLTRLPDAVDLCAEVGLGHDLVAPSAGAAMVWTDAGMRDLPGGLVLGAPSNLRAIRDAAMLTRRGRARAALDRVLPARCGDDDLSVHDLVTQRFGQEVASRLVDPLVGGIHAGRSEELSARATTPQLFAAAQQSRSMMRGLTAGGASPAGPMFLAPAGGLGALVDRLVGAMVQRGVTFRRRAVERLNIRSDRRIEVDSDTDSFDAAILAVPAAGAAAILGPSAPAALGSIPTASVAMVLMSFDAGDLSPPPGVSGFLVPRSTGRLMTACSFASSKWPSCADPGVTLLRISVGRAGDHRAEHMADEELTGRLRAELGCALGVLRAPGAVRIRRWPDAFPQYLVGHLDRVREIRRHLGGLGAAVAVAGASYDGSGIPACIGSGRRAAAGFAWDRAGRDGARRGS